MRKLKNPQYHIQKGLKIFYKSVRRKKKKRRLKAGNARHSLNIKKYAEEHGTVYYFKKTKRNWKKQRLPKPERPIYLQFLTGTRNSFDKKNYGIPKEANLIVPECFSLIDHSEESFRFLRLLFDAIQNGGTEKIFIDYSKCERIDVDASICMDLILAQHIKYLNDCKRRGYDDVFPNFIQPINFNRPHINKILFSIGAYSNLRGFNIRYSDTLPLPVLVNSQDREDRWNVSEIDLTKIVEYIKQCLGRMGRELTQEAETEFYKVVGEVMSNAEEHSSMPHRFAIGFFQEYHNDEQFGIFNFSIFNFGDTIYDTFKSAKCKNPKVVKQMEELSEDYTKRGWFLKPDFQEETLWTLYALQEGVTSKEKKRGNGSIQYIENFFRLKGDLIKDDVSKLVIMSGNTRVVFDGTYKIFEKPSKDKKREFKMITFNKSQDIHDKPDQEFVTFAPQFFPGTMISARILIKFDNTKSGV